MPIIAVDFDGTLCENKFPEIGEPKQDIIDKVIALQVEGWKTILWTCREIGALDNAVAWCKERGLTFDAINDDLPEIKEEFKSGSMYRSVMLKEGTRCGAKIFANVYLDDRAVHIDNF